MKIKKIFLVVTLCATISETLSAAENNRLPNNCFISQQPLSEQDIQKQIIRTAQMPLKPVVTQVSVGALSLLASAYNPEPCTQICCFVGGFWCVTLGLHQYGNIKDSRKVCTQLNLPYN